MYTNIFYFNNLNKIGGTETFLYYIAKKYKKYDITVFYKTGDIDQVNRLKKYVRTIKYNGNNIECEKAFFNYRPDIIDKIKSKKNIQVIHANYKAQNKPAPVNNLIDEYIGVSQEVCDAFKELSGKDIKLCYNPISIDEPEKVLFLCSATRLSKEKGVEELKKLGKILDSKGIKYIWFIFTNNFQKVQELNNPNIIALEPRLDITSYIKRCDFLVQLSHEAYGYSIVESLTVGTPVIVLDIPVFNELNINETNSIKLKKDFDDIDRDLLLKEYKFTYEAPKDIWDELLVKKKSTYKEELNMKVRVKCIRNYYDMETNERKVVSEFERYDEPEKHPNRIEWITTRERADHLVDKGLVKIVEVIKEQKKIEKATPKKKTEKR